MLPDPEAGANPTAFPFTHRNLPRPILPLLDTEFFFVTHIFLGEIESPVTKKAGERINESSSGLYCQSDYYCKQFTACLHCPIKQIAELLKVIHLILLLIWLRQSFLVLITLHVNEIIFTYNCT